MDPLITLTTDFGTRDPYVAAMKGVLLTLCPAARVVDLSHEIAPHDVLEGALFLAAAVPYFPPGAVHLAVVDPGVGSARRGIVASVSGQLVVYPDNGLLELLQRADAAVAMHAITGHPDLEAAASPTFHGRDLFAPVAARLAAGAWTIEDVGPPVEDAVRLKLPALEQLTGDALVATVIHVDRFGNAITNVDASHVPAGAHCEIGGDELAIVRTYADVAIGAPCALVGGAGLLEIAINQGSAAEYFGLRRGDHVLVAGGGPTSPARA